MSNIELQDKLDTYSIEEQIKAYENKVKQNFQDWQELESFSILLKQKKMPLKADFFSGQAENLFLNSYPQIERDELLFEGIDWADYVEFYIDLKRASFTKLRAIRHLYLHGLVEGRLGRYLIAIEKIDLAVNFFTSKILKYPQKKIFYIGYQKLLTKISNLPETANPNKKIKQQTFSPLIKLQLQLIKDNLSLKEKLLQTKKRLQQLEYQVKYQEKLNQADNLSKQDILKLKSLKNDPQYPKVGEISNDDVAIAGKADWIFINAGSNNLMEYHTGKKQLSPPKINQWNQLLQQRIEWHQVRQIAYQHIFIPNKIAVYSEYYPHNINVVNNRPIKQLQKKCQQLFLYPIDLFFEQKAHYQLYDKQDCHWNFWGCYFAYSLICQSLGIKPKLKLLDIPLKISKKKGDLGNKFGLKERSPQADFQFTSQIAYDNQVINHCHQGSIRILKNERIPHGKMIIFGDSFSNPGFPNYTTKKRLAARLASLFAETLNEVHFVWTPWVDFAYIEREKPDFVLTEMAERFLVKVPDDRDHLPLNEFAAMKLSQYN